MGFFQGSEVVVKVLVAGVGHLGEKWERIEWVGFMKGIMREWYHCDQCEERNPVG
jgi:hypothetical protein